MKKLMLISLVPAVIALILLSGCVMQTNNNEGRREDSSEGKTETEMKSYEEDTIPDTVKVTKGSMFEISLEANPTTGYTWQVYFEDEEVLEFAGSDHEVDNPDVDGSGGVTTLIFKALEKGETRVTLEYAQNWEGGDTDKTREITVVVE